LRTWQTSLSSGKDQLRLVITSCTLAVVEGVAGLEHDVGVTEEAHGHDAADLALAHLGAEGQEPAAQRVVGAQSGFNVGVVIQFDLADAEAVQRGLVQLVASDVLAIGSGAEGIGGGDAHEVGMLDGGGLVGSVGHSHVSVGQCRVDDYLFASRPPRRWPVWSIRHGPTCDRRSG
jgi:hypothetical protein